MDKHLVAQTLEEIAILLELKGENPFKVRAYSNAARAIESMSEDLGPAVEAGTLTQVQGIGKSLAIAIAEIWKTGRLQFHEDLLAETPPGYRALIRVPGLGPTKVRILVAELDIQTVEQLKAAAEQGRIRNLKGFGTQSEKKILHGITVLEAGAGRWLGAEIRPLAEDLLGSLRKLSAVKEAEVGGSIRRWMETVKDVDLLVATTRPADVTKAFLALVPSAAMIGSGETKTSVRLASGLAIDLRLVKPKEFPFALHYFTGSAAHNIRIRSRALDRGWTLNEYALTSVASPEGRAKASGSTKASGGGAKRTQQEPPRIASEADLFSALGLSYIEPELREDRGEIEAAEANSLPKLIELADLRGFLHCHTTYSDGHESVHGIAEAAERAGAEYLGISDHSMTATYARGVSEGDLKLQHKEIDRWNSGGKRLRILKGAEVDILPDGTLDYPERVLERLDFVIASIHTHFAMGEAEMTARVVRAIRNPYVSILAHPTGRLLFQRDGFRLRFQEIFEAAAAEKVVVEVNSNPRRLELDWRELRPAKDRGVKFAVNPDAHSAKEFLNLRYGIGAARKGWLTKADVINTLSLERIVALFRSRRK